jgi:hypothetical protein
LSFACHTTWPHLVTALSHWLPQTSLGLIQTPGRCEYGVILSSRPTCKCATAMLPTKMNFHTANSLECKKLTHHARTRSLVNKNSHI